MNEEHLQAERNLIDALLNCTEGQERKLLQAHPELLDSDFIEVMEQVADELQEKGDEKRAYFWRNLADSLALASFW